MLRPHMLAVPLLMALFALAPGSAFAHHTFTAKYDPSKTVKVSGTIASVSYGNPHIDFTVEAGGKSWSVETESISVAKGLGLTEAVLKAGAKVTVTGWPARDGSAEMGLSSISVVGGPTITTRRTAR